MTWWKHRHLASNKTQQALYNVGTMAVGGLAVTEDSGSLCEVNISDGTALKHEGAPITPAPTRGVFTAPFNTNQWRLLFMTSRSLTESRSRRCVHPRSDSWKRPAPRVSFYLTIYHSLTSIVGLSNTIGSAWSYLRIKSLLRELIHQKTRFFIIYSFSSCFEPI